MNAIAIAALITMLVAIVWGLKSKTAQARAAR